MVKNTLIALVMVVGWVSPALADCHLDCETNYAELVTDSDGYMALWCVPDSVAEGCIEVSSLLDCSVMSEEVCDETMGVMFEACVQLAYSASEEK